MLKELGLGLVLMLAGDGELARRAGDALIRDKVRDALEEGGFEEVAYAGWDKGYRDGRFWVGFDSVAVVRRGARLEASAARIFPLSVDLEFEAGRVVTASSARSWSFDRVTVDGDFSLFSEGLEVRGAGLEDGAGGDAGGTERFCLFREGCAYEASFGSARVPAFALAVARRGADARVHFAWEETEGCVELLLEDVAVPRGTALAALGEGLLADRWPATAVLREGVCALEGPVPGVAEVRAEERAPWASRDPRIDEVLAVLLVALPEAYAYLVE